MDLPLYFRVVWRFRMLVLPGVLLAIALAVLSYGKVDLAHGLKVTPRRAPVFQADGLLLITQHGFPWGSSQQQYVAGDAAKGLPPAPIGDFSRMSGIAMIYSELADSDAVRALTRPKPSKTEKVVTSPYAPASAPPGTVLPMVALSAQAATAARAALLVDARVDAFRRYLLDRQARAKTPDADRVVIQVLKRGDPATATQISGAKKTLPIVVFLAVVTAVLGLAFMLENMRPQIRPLEAPALEARRSA
ncbi:MAG TPA: hypothetical protein VFL66_05765 [Gaiellaceae bacterium]|nr:hypothetical protein [Gaiellaceae bacterium]